MIGIDREELWVAKAAQRTITAGFSQRFQYRVALAESLPFDDGTFDLVTCQTLLMHVPNAEHVLSEMLRVTRQAVPFLRPSRPAWLARWWTRSCCGIRRT